MGVINNNAGKLVSIIIPAYNVGNYIEECLSSVMAQSYGNIEIIVVDDGSKDDTYSLIEAAMAKDARVKGFHRENSGVSSTRNFGISKASGEYICFVDGDDYISSDMIEILVDTVEKDDVDWVNCRYRRVDDNGNQLDEFDFLDDTVKTTTDNDRLNLILGPLMDYQLGYEVWDKLYKTSIIKKHNISFIEDCHIGEDLAFNICYGLFADGISSISERPYYYRVRNNSAMGTVTSINKNFIEHLALIKGVKPYFDDAIDCEVAGRFYQLFFKIMCHASHGYTAVETAEVAVALDDSFYKLWLKESLRHKEHFADFYYYDMAMLYYRFGLYIQTKLERDLFGGIYLKIYDLYRSMRKRPTIGEWKVQ